MEKDTLRLTRAQLLTLLLLGLLLCLSAGMLWYYLAGQSASVAESPAASALQANPGEGEAYTNLAGEAVALDQYLGTVLVVLSWASWCPQCAEELTRIERVTAAYDATSVRYLAINRAEPKETAERFVNYHGISDRRNIILDPSDRYYTTIGGFAMPEILIYDAAGQIHTHIRGQADDEVLRQAIERALDSDA